MPPRKSTATAARSLKIDTPRVFLPLLGPARYKGAYGGRGSGKSHFFAELLIEDCLCERGVLAVSIREVQKSLKDSSKRLIEAKLAQLGLGEADGFKVYEKEIRGGRRSSAARCRSHGPMTCLRPILLSVS